MDDLYVGTINRHYNTPYVEYAKLIEISGTLHKDLTRFNNIAIQGTPQMAVDEEAISLSRVHSYYSKCNLPNFYE